MKRKAVTTLSTPRMKELLKARLFDAPVQTVFEAWADPAKVEKWWGPHDFVSQLYEWEVRPGGPIHLEMIGPHHLLYALHGAFHEVREPERLLFTATILKGEKGLKELEVLNTIILLPYRKKTRLTLQSVVIRSAPGTPDCFRLMRQSWKESLDRLADFLSKRAGPLYDN